jgi:hypothetical protein
MNDVNSGVREIEPVNDSPAADDLGAVSDSYGNARVLHKVS